MNLTSLGDLSQNTYMFTRGAQLKQNLAELQQELSTGKTSNITERLGGNFNYLSEIERNISRLDSFDTIISETSLYASSTQAYVGLINDIAGDFGNDLIRVSGTATETSVNQLSSQSRELLEQTISALNGQAGGRSLFAGTDTDAVPVADADTILTALIAEVGGLTTAADVSQAVHDWFDDPAGFDAVAYNGSFTSMAPVRIGPNETVDIGLRADADEFKQAMASFAIGALADDPALGFSASLKKDIVVQTGNELLTTRSVMTSLQADFGFTEERIDETAARNAAAKTSLSLAKNEIIQADPYETVTRLEEAQFQLEAIYTVTARSSSMSLLSFMR